MSSTHTVLITGAAGYVGLMLAEKFARRDDVEKIVGLDKEEIPSAFAKHPKIAYIRKNTSDAWEEEAARYQPDIVIHAAWQIRDLYGRSSLQTKWNIEGSDRVFDFAFANSYVKRLVYFSTVASYGAYPDNTIEHRFTENDPFRESDYRYAEEKRISELHLTEKYERAKKAREDIAVAIVRPAAITGPRGRFARIRFGLQSALSGQLAGSIVYRFVALLTSFVPATRNWARQFVHEDDVVDIVEILSFDERVRGYGVFNLCAPGKPVLAGDMARAVGKRVMRVPALLVRFVFFVMWHGTFGKIPTSRGAWRGYSYPIMVDGSKVTSALGYQYRMPGSDAFVYTDGRYEFCVPRDKIKKRPL